MRKAARSVRRLYGLRRHLSDGDGRRLSQPLPEGQAGSRDRNPPPVRAGPIALIRADRQHWRWLEMADAAHSARAESARDILFALLVPSPKQTEALQGNDTWDDEARALLDATLGLKLKTRGKTWSSVADELWRYLLFSEFRFDLPGELPAALANVPHAPDAARAMVEDLCDGCAPIPGPAPSYIERAERSKRSSISRATAAGRRPRRSRHLSFRGADDPVASLSERWTRRPTRRHPRASSPPPGLRLDRQG